MFATTTKKKPTVIQNKVVLKFFKCYLLIDTNGRIQVHVSFAKFHKYMCIFYNKKYTVRSITSHVVITSLNISKAKHVK